MTHGLSWVKYQKLCHNTHTPFPREREGSLTAKSLSPLAKKKKKNGLTVHSWIPPSSKFMSKKFFFGKITVNHTDFTHFTNSPHELRKIGYKIHLH